MPFLVLVSMKFFCKQRGRAHKLDATHRLSGAAVPRARIFPQQSVTTRCLKLSSACLRQIVSPFAAQSCAALCTAVASFMSLHHFSANVYLSKNPYTAQAQLPSRITEHTRGRLRLVSRQPFKLIVRSPPTRHRVTAAAKRAFSLHRPSLQPRSNKTKRFHKARAPAAASARALSLPAACIWPAPPAAPARDYAQN